VRELISGEGIGLRAAVASDRERWLELFGDADELRYGVPAVVTLPQTVEDLDDRVSHSAEALAAGDPGALVIVPLDEPERFLGSAAWAFHVPAPLRVADIGYGVHPDSRGRGVATRAVRILTRWLTSDDDGPGLARVQLDHSVENVASCRTALAAGFEKEGVRRHFLPLRDEDSPTGERRHDVCLHGFVPEAPVSTPADRGQP
jgi:RimJ/RimL family protein N-acetyltransferase